MFGRQLCIKSFLFASMLLFSLPTHASFIESTIGTAVVNDATATYYNPAALTLLKKPQLITQGSIAYFHSEFKGQSTQTSTSFTQTGNSYANTHYYLPSAYIGIPIKNKITLGLAVLSNDFNRDIEGNSILRYVQSNNSIQNVDFVPALSIKLNEYFSLGAGLNFSYARFLMKPTIGFPSLNIPDSQSRNDSNGRGFGGDVGFLLKPSSSTLIGFNYRSSITYRLAGKSVFEGDPELVSNQYYFYFWTPARSVLSLNHFVTQRLGFITTVQYIQWSIFKNVHIHGIATQIGSQPPTIIPEAVVPYYLHNSWLLTLGSHYRLTPKWVIRVASSYAQSPANSHYQISNGDSIILGASTGYEIFKNVSIDGSYAHAFMKNERINIKTGRNIIHGINSGSRDGISLKLTLNV